MSFMKKHANEEKDNKTFIQLVWTENVLLNLTWSQRNQSLPNQFSRTVYSHIIRKKKLFRKTSLDNLNYSRG